MSSPILVIGSFAQDLCFYVDEFPQPGQTLTGTFVTGPGGKGFNQATAAMRTGVQTAFVGAVGADAFGKGAEKFLAKEGVERQLIQVTGATSGAASIVVNHTGQNAIVVALGANEKFTAPEVNPALIESAEVIVMQFEIHLETVRSLLELAREKGKITLLNPAPMNSAMDFFMLKNVDVFLPNEAEFVTVIQRHPKIADASFSMEKLTALLPETLHQLCRELDVPTVIVTLGARGCFVSEPASFIQIPACPGIQAIDTTGAGDAFVGGFASGLIQFSGDIVRAARYGNVVAGLSVTKRGTAPSMPVKSEIDEFLRQLT